jgi:hypothetical protein
MAGLAFYLVARKLLRMPYSLFTLGIYWFWAPFPAYLINWARYPYLQSLVLLPVAVQIYRDHSLNRRSRYILLTWLLIGLGLTYYGTVVIFIAFVIMDLIVSISTQRHPEIFPKMRGLALATLPILVILLIRLYHAFEFGIYGQDSTVSLLEDGIQALNISLTHGGWLLWGLGIPGLCMALIFRFERFLLMAGWFLVLLTINLLQAMLNVTVSSLANTIIFLSIPLTLLAGLAFKCLWVITMQRIRLSLYLVILLMAVSGAYNISGIVQSSTTLFLTADRSAMDWITHNTPADSVYLINSFWWGDDRAPSDGGGWLTTITKRKSVLYVPENFERSIENEDIDFVYTGRGYGDLHSELLANDERFSLAYDKDGIKIFKRKHLENSSTYIEPNDFRFTNPYRLQTNASLLDLDHLNSAKSDHRPLPSSI